MARYTQRNAKFPISIEAVRWEEGAVLPEWCSAIELDGATARAQTPDGPREAIYGDYLVKGMTSAVSESIGAAQTTIYVTAPEVFEARYELSADD